MAIAEKFWITPEEMCGLLGVTKKTLWAWRKEKRGPPYYRICGMVRYKRDDFNKWLDAQRNPTT